MPKNSSARRRRRARRIASTESVSYRQALARGEQRLQRPPTDPQLLPLKITVDGLPRYHRHDDAVDPTPDSMLDPTGPDVVRAADVLLARLAVLRSVRLRPVTVTDPGAGARRVVQCPDIPAFHAAVPVMVATVRACREDADIAWVESHTVARLHGVRCDLGELERRTAGPLREHVATATGAADELITIAEATHGRGCLLSAGTNRSRRGQGWSPCSEEPVRLRLRVRAEEVTITDPGCPRHAAEEIAYRDFDVLDDYAAVEILGGTDADLDLVYTLAEQVRDERFREQNRRDATGPGGRSLPVPPWMRRRD